MCSICTGVQRDSYLLIINHQLTLADERLMSLTPHYHLPSHLVTLRVHTSRGVESWHISLRLLQFVFRLSYSRASDSARPLGFGKGFVNLR